MPFKKLMRFMLGMVKESAQNRSPAFNNDDGPLGEAFRCGNDGVSKPETKRNNRAVPATKRLGSPFPFPERVSG
jgi:hypothetical protein